MTRVAYLLHNFPGKTDTFIRREIRSLKDQGVSVAVISVWHPNERETTPDILAEWINDTTFLLPRSALSIGVSSLKAFGRQPLHIIKALAYALRTARPGLKGLLYQLFYFVEAVLASEALRAGKFTHVHNHIGDQSGTVTMLAAKLTGLDYSITFHGWPVFFDAKSSSVKEKVQGARFVRAISYFCRSQLMMFADSDDPTKYKVVHCGLQMQRYAYRSPVRPVRTLFCAARLSPEKGLTFLLRALAELRGRGHDLRLKLAGGGPSHDRLVEMASHLQISDKVEFLGFVDETRIIEELRQADLFVLPSFVEGVPVSAMEAMAIGVPVIATNIAGTSELVEGGSTGTLVRPADVGALVSAVEDVISNYDFRLRSAERARKKVETEFDVDTETAKLRSHLLDDTRSELGSAYN